MLPFNRMMKILNSFCVTSFVALTLQLTACSSGPKPSEYAADRVVGRSDELTSRPKWVSETMSVSDQGDNTNFIGMSETPGDSRVQAAFKMSDAAARGHLANKIETNVTKIVQSSETGLSMDEQQLRSLIQEISQTTLHSVDIKERYWEKVVHTETGGTEVVHLKTFSLISIPKAEIKKMVIASIDQSKDAKPVKGDFKTLVNDKWEKVSAE